jgi:hypothetical protein
MESKIESFITKEYLLSQLVNFNKEILNDLYYRKSYGESVESKTNTLIGEDENLSVREIVKNLQKMSLHIVDKLPMPNSEEVDTDGLYIVPDTNSIDEKAKQFVYVITVEDNVNKWLCISTPSNVFENERINFTDAFTRVSNKYSLRTSFTTGLLLLEYVKANGETQNYLGSDCYCYDFLTTDFVDCCVFYNEETGNVYYFSELSYKNIDAASTSYTSTCNITDTETINSLANTIQNPEGDLVNGDE